MPKMNPNLHWGRMAPPRAACGGRVSWTLMALVLSLGGFALWAHAEKEDREEPLHFVADAARVEEAKKLEILTGNVDLTKGSMFMHAERVDIQQSSQGAQTATATGGRGGRSYFKQNRDATDEVIEGEAEKIVYDGSNDTVLLIGRAVLRRLSSGVQTDEVNGPRIRYDNKRSVYQVIGADSNDSAAPSSSGRVSGFITPRPSDDAASGASAPSRARAAPAAAASGTVGANGQ